MKNLKIPDWLKVSLGCLIILGLLAFTKARAPRTDLLSSVEVTLDNNHNNHFLDQDDIIIDLYALKEENDEMTLKEMEVRLKENEYIKEVEVYQDLKANLIVNVELRRPMARLIRKYKSDLYISYDGHVIPVSTKYNTRVPLISGAYAEKFDRYDMMSEKDIRFFKLLKFIDADPFLKAQVAQLDVDEQLDIKIYPQVTKQIIEFGKPEKMDLKFNKLKIFYRQILPRKGWNTYDRVNLEFDGQIVAE